MQVSRYLFLLVFIAASFCSHAQDRRETDTLLISDSTEESSDSDSVDMEEIASYEKQTERNEKLVKVKDSFSFRQVPDTISENLKKNKTFEYANDPSYWVKEEVKPRKRGFWDYFYDFFSKDAVRSFFYILLALLILFVLYRVIVVNNLYVFYSSRKNKNVSADEEAEGIEDDKLDDKINASIAAQEYRTAVRYLYLKSLRLLNDKGWIHYSSQSTNYDYVKQAASFPVAKDFVFLTRAYEYVWYGEFEINKSQFETLYTSFKNLYSSVKI